jgi:hypothetical protein
MIAARRASLAVLALVLTSVPSGGQAGGRVWNDSATLEVVSRAIARRAAQLADTGLVDYKAKAHGYLTFFAQVGEGFPDPPKIVRADEIAVEVYWLAPNYSKQRVVGRRDTLLLPTDINYHRDHLAVVQNNFPSVIRLGDGDEVRDVPHPLSAVGRQAYDFAVADSLSIRVAGRAWDVIAVDVRPRDDRLPRVVGTVYLDRATGSIVRLNATFTRAALIDPALEDVSVALDNGLVDGRFWLPRRQEIEIRRTGEWLEFPARGIIRGEWDLCCVEANQHLGRELFVGPEISIAPPSELAKYPFEGKLGDSLRARIISAGADRPAAALLDRARELVRAEAVTRATALAGSARSISDFVRVNRVEGLALGGGATVRVAPMAQLRGSVRYGLDDALFKFRASLSLAAPFRSRITLGAFDEYRDARVVPEMSRLGNSFAAQEIGADYTDEYRVSGYAATLSWGSTWRGFLEIERTRERALTVHATPYSGSYRAALPAEPWKGTRALVSVSSPAMSGPFDLALKFSARASFTWQGGDSAGQRLHPSHFERLTSQFSAIRATSLGEWEFSALAIAAGGGSPLQSGAILGGPTTAPGYPASMIRRRGAGLARIEWRVPVGGFAISLGRFGTTRVPILLAPFANQVWNDTDLGSSVGSSHRSIGLGLITAHDLLRIDIARGVDRLGRWILYADFGKAFRPIL